jgi:[protein-PII] uridylyltransferase
MLPIVKEVKSKLADGRDRIRAEHESGLSGRQVTSQFADLADSTLLELIHEALDFVTDGDRGRIEKKIALVPHGGYGRRDLAPYSDIDLMLLYRLDAKADVEPFARRLTQNIVDVGFDLGFSSRTPADAVSLALKDIPIYTSLVESRYLAGSVGIYTKFLSRLARQAQRRPQGLIRAIEASRREEQQRNGDTAFLLRPNVKRTRGGLRDIQLIRWLGFTKHGESDLDALSRVGALSEHDHKNVSAAYRFLLRLRNEMHFEAGKARDVLGMNEQVRIAARWGYEKVKGELPVERFMRDYFEHTSEVVYAADHALAAAKSRFQFSDLITPFFSQREEGYFLVGPVNIATTKNGLEYVKENLEGVLHLMSLANLHNKYIDHSTWVEIRNSMINSESLQLTQTCAWRFCSFMSDGNRLGDLLRRLHEMRVLEKIIPAFEHVRCLVQFNEYHKYTVDEHSIRVVEAATHYQDRNDILGRCYKSIKNKKVLHLALLLHDIGKGFEEDHSIVGARITEETAKLLNLDKRETKALVFLVRHHLLMSHLVFRRDTSDETLVASFAADVGSTDMLKMLFVLTCADLEGVGPDSLSDWKLNLISQFYFRSLKQLSGETSEDIAEFVVGRAKQELCQELKDDGAKVVSGLAEKMSSEFFEFWPNEKARDLLEKIADMHVDGLLIEANHQKEQDAIEYLVGKFDKPYSAVFHRITGALTSQRVGILSVEITKLDSDRIVYRFKVSDPDLTTHTLEARIESIKSVILDALENEDRKLTFSKIWGHREGPSTEAATFPTRIKIDNDTVDHATIIDVFTHDKTGLLYTITQSIHDLGLQITAAKVGTYLDQVVDVFYVTDASGKKIKNAERLREIKVNLLDQINQNS